MNNTTNFYEQYLKDISFDSQRMSILQPQTGVKLQNIFIDNKRYIKSISDAHQDIRILIFSLIIKMYSGNMNIHHLWQQKFKKIIYNSELKTITLQKGLLKQQLHKTVYDNLCLLTNIQQNIQKLFEIVNNIPFFDEVIMSSMKNNFQIKKPKDLNCWLVLLSEQFDMMVIKKDKNQQYKNQNGQNVIYIQEQNNMVLFQYQYYKNHCFLSKQKQEGSQISFVETSFGKFCTQQKISVPISCQSIQSPNMQKQNIDFSNIRISRSRQSSKLKNIQNTPIRISQHQKNRSSFWTIFCCGGD